MRAAGDAGTRHERLPRRCRRRWNVHRPHLRDAHGRDRARQDPEHARRPVARRDERAGPARRALRPLAPRPLRAARDPRARHDHGRQHDDRDERRGNGPARNRGPPRRDRAPPLPQGTDLGPELPGPDPDRPPPGTDPDPRAHGPHGQGRAPARRRSRTARCATPQALGVRSIAVDVPVLVREPRSRAPHARDRARGVSRRRAHLALARGHAARPEFERVSTTS